MVDLISTFRKAAAIVATAVVAATLVACGSDSSDSESAKPSYLFSFEGDDVVMTQEPGKATVYNFRMPVDSTSKVVTWFTDRPVRDAGIMPLTDFVAQWSKGGTDGFKTDPPNVSIVYGPVGHPLTMIATMSAARIIGSGASEALEATMTVVPEETRSSLATSDRHLASHAKRSTVPTAPPSAQMTKKVAVFVDPEVGLSDN